MASIEKARAALAANPLPESPFLGVIGDTIIIRSGFSEQLLQLLRFVPKVEWRPDKRCWIVPLTGLESVRAVLPEVLRLAELTRPQLREGTGGGGVDTSSPRDLFQSAARLLFGTDWQRDTARALGRDEVALARWMAGEASLEDADVLLAEMLALMRRRAEEISRAADRFGAVIASTIGNGERA
jgi:hypothetical protein